jgi:hypothetical protein
MASERIAIAGFYRGVGLHADQGPDRIADVRRDIDEVFLIDRTSELFAYLRDVRRSPEARLFAGAKLRARWELATEDREARPKIDIQLVDAIVMHLGARKWQSSTHYCSALDTPAAPGEPGPIPRPAPLDRPPPREVRDWLRLREPAKMRATFLEKPPAAVTE